MDQTRTGSKSAFRRFTLFLLPLLTVFALYSVGYLSFKNDLLPRIDGIFEQDEGQRYFPGTETSLIEKYTGLQALDRKLSTLVAFFAPVVENRDPSMFMFTIWAIGQFTAVWTLLFMESLRQGNEGKASSWIGTFGIIFQNLTLAVSTPLYLLIHLLTSPIAQPLSLAYSPNVLLIPASDLAVLPFSILIGFILPSALMVSHGEMWPLGSPTHQTFIALWQIFPIITVTTHWLLKKLFTTASQQGTQNSVRVSQSSPAERYLRSSGRIYTVILIACILTHLPVLIICSLSAYFSPLDIFPHLVRLTNGKISPKLLLGLAEFGRNLSPSSVFLPPLPYPNQEPISSLTAGVQTFLQWDVYISATATLLWTVVLYRSAAQVIETVSQQSNVSLPDSQVLIARAQSRKNSGLWRLLVKVVSWTVLAGPFGAVSVLLWERDQIVKQKVKKGI